MAGALKFRAPQADAGRVLARLREERLLWAIAICGAVVLGWLGLQDFAFTDYDVEVSAAYRSLIDGDLSGFLAQVPAYGGSMVLRLPFAALTAALGGGEIAVYRAVSIPGLVALVVLAIVLARCMAERGLSRGMRVLVVVLCAINPVTLQGLQIGHPEELMCTAFAVGALLAASRERPLLAAVLLGLAIGTKAWAVLAIGPVLLALPARRLFVLAVAGAVTGLIMLPLLFAGSADQIVHGARQTGILFNPWQIWWPLGDVVNVGYDGLPKPGARFAPAWLAQITHPLIASLVVPLSLLWWHRRRHEGLHGDHLLALLALLMLLRCILDPWNTSYYQLPLVISLLGWEALCRTWQPPVLTLAASAATWVTFVTLRTGTDPNLLCAIYLAWALPLAAWLAYAAFWPARAHTPRVDSPARSAARTAPPLQAH